MIKHGKKYYHVLSDGSDEKLDDVRLPLIYYPKQWPFMQRSIH